METTVAIVSLGGKQHLVKQGDQLIVNRLLAKEGTVLDLPDILNNRVVQARVLSHHLGKKVNGLKFKAKTRYFKRYGHRQTQTAVEVLSISEIKLSLPAKPVAAKKVTAEKPVIKKVATKSAGKVVDV